MTRARELSKLGSINALSVDSSYNIGVGSTSPDAKLDVAGIVSATYFYGDQNYRRNDVPNCCCSTRAE